MPQQPKPTLVMLHGWAVHSEIWHSVSAALAEQFQLLPIDMPGYGSRHAENGDLDLAGLTDDVLQRVPKNAHWLGWSLRFDGRHQRSAQVTRRNRLTNSGQPHAKVYAIVRLASRHRRTRV